MGQRAPWYGLIELPTLWFKPVKNEQTFSKRAELLLAISIIMRKPALNESPQCRNFRLEQKLVQGLLVFYRLVRHPQLSNYKLKFDCIVLKSARSCSTTLLAQQKDSPNYAHAN